MTTIITRLYKNKTTAQRVAKALSSAGFPDETVDVIEQGDDTAKRIEATEVSTSVAQSLAPKVDHGNCLLVVRAPFVPFGAARKAREICAAETVVEARDEYRSDAPAGGELAGGQSILANHPRFLTPAPGDKNYRGPRTITDGYGFSLLSERKPPVSGVRDRKPVTGGFFKLLSDRVPPIQGVQDRKPVTGGFMKLLSDTSRRQKSVLEDGGPVFSRALGIPTLLER